MRSSNYLLMIFISFGLWNCTTEDLERREFLQIALAVDSLDIDQFKLTATISDWESKPLDKHGFIWATSDKELSFFSLDDSDPRGVLTKDQDNTFTAVVEDLNPNTSYTFAAYVEINGEWTPVYSRCPELHPGKPDFFCLARLGAVGFSLELEESGQWRGYVVGNQPWSDWPQYPLEFNPDTVINEKRGHWRQMDEGSTNEVGRHDAIGFALKKRGYIGFGGSDSNDNQSDFWEYTPE